MTHLSGKAEKTTNELVEQLQRIAAESKLIKGTPYTYPALPSSTLLSSTPVLVPSSSSTPPSSETPVSQAEDLSTSGSECSRQHHLVSWKVQEEVYRNPPFELPTMARGLFTERHEGQHRIVARGYEKFFNVGEMSYTNWDSLEETTQAPYYLTLKSNGCLILLSAIEEEVLLVTSKHALGDMLDGERVSHNRMGRIWVEKHLSRVGKTEKELAKVLWEKQLTGVAELCDDSFEEHVLSYPSHLTGLHLHGLNHNTPSFSTLSPYEVASFAREWGFIETKIVEKATLREAREFAQDIETKEEFDGEKIEGFVVRCTVKPGPEPKTAIQQGMEKLAVVDSSDDQSALSSAAAQDAKRRTISPPYPPGSTFFFKIKFDQPYLLYRNFREITKILLPLLSPATPKTANDSSSVTSIKPTKQPKVSSSRLSSPEAVVYEAWCRRTMRSDPNLFSGIAVGRGIIDVRNRFLDWITSDDEGKETLRREKGNPKWLKIGRNAGGEKAGDGKRKGKGKGEEDIDKDGAQAEWKERGKNGWGKTMLVPVAVPGCGKTTLAVALRELFGFAHTQSDNIAAKKTGPLFNKAVGDLLNTKGCQVVIADRNNHLSQHRKELATTALKADHKDQRSLPTRLIGLYWPIKGFQAPASTNEVTRLCSSRITSRGDNHPCLRPDPNNLAAHEVILKTHFLLTADPLLDQELDDIIRLDVRSSPEETLDIALNGLTKLLGLERPDEPAIKHALKMAREYSAEISLPPVVPAKIIPPRYYAIAPEVDIRQIVQQILDDHLVQSPQTSIEFPTDPRTFLFNLVNDYRITVRPHITLCHETEVAAEREGIPETDWKTKAGPMAICWNQCRGISQIPTLPLFSFEITHLVWDDRVMALAVDQIEPPVEIPNLRLKIPEEEMEGSHFTVGTRDPEVNAYEARGLVKDFKRGTYRKEMGVIELKKRIEGHGRVLGLS